MRHPDADPEDKSQRAVQSVEVGGRLLLELAASPGPMGLKDLAAAAELPASRAHPYLVSFGKLQLIEQDTATGHYALGPAALQLGLACLRQLDPLRAAQPVADALAQRSGHAVALAVWGNFGPTIVRMIDARQPLHVSMRAGTVMSILGTATGRAFAAVLPRARVDEALARDGGGALGSGTGDLPRSADAPAQAGRRAAPATVTAPTTLTAASAASARPRPPADLALDHIAAEWQAHRVLRAAGRPLPGVNAFSAPAFNHEGEAVIVITVLDHQDRLAADWDSPAARAVQAAAAEVSARLGGPAT